MADTAIILINIVLFRRLVINDFIKKRPKNQCYIDDLYGNDTINKVPMETEVATNNGDISNCEKYDCSKENGKVVSETKSNLCHRHSDKKGFHGNNNNTCSRTSEPL